MARKIIVILFCGTIIIVVSSWLFISLYGHFRSLDWVESTAQVTSIIESGKSATINYRYKFGNSEFVGNNFAFLSSGSVPDKSYIMSNYEEGDVISIFVDPNNPQDSVVLRRKIALEYFATHILVISILLVFGYLLGFGSNENLTKSSSERC